MIGRGGRPASGRELYEKWRRPLKLVERSFSILPAGLRRAALGCLAVLPGSVGMAFRVIALRDRGAGVGDAVYIARSAVFKNVRSLQIGDRVSIHDFCYIDADGGIAIGSDVAIAHATSILSSEHTWSDDCFAIKYNPTKRCRVEIESDVWIGCGVRVLGGSHIASRSVIAAGAVVKGTLQGGGLYGGVPAKRIKALVQ